MLEKDTDGDGRISLKEFLGFVILAGMYYILDD